MAEATEAAEMEDDTIFGSYVHKIQVKQILKLKGEAFAWPIQKDLCRRFISALSILHIYFFQLK